MTKMSKAQRTAVLVAHRFALRDRYASGTAYANPRTMRVLRREGWTGAYDQITRAGLIAAGVDMDAIHADALIEDEAREVAKVGAIVQRRGEVGPHYPIGRVTHVAEGNNGPLVNVSFSGLPGLWASPTFYVRASAEAIDAHSSDYWERATKGLPRVAAF